MTEKNNTTATDTTAQCIRKAENAAREYAAGQKDNACLGGRITGLAIDVLTGGETVGIPTTIGCRIGEETRKFLLSERDKRAIEQEYSEVHNACLTEMGVLPPLPERNPRHSNGILDKIKGLSPF